ncbi:MAG: FecR domain-containing protein [bacterium]
MKKRFFFIIILIVFTFMLSILFHAYATKPESVIKLGEITSFTGEVLVKTNGNWSKLKKTPTTLFNTDKIVTRRGRAEVRLVDGGIIRIDLDSNLSIAEKEDAEGFMVRKKVTARQVNLLIGDIWFDIKVEKGKRVKFRTPTMTAGIRGTSGAFKVDINGKTEYGLATGKADTIGNYDEISNPKPISHADVTARNLPKSNPVVDNSPIQQNAIRAFEDQIKATLAAQKAADLLKLAKSAGERAAMAQTEAARLQAKEAQKAAILAQSEAEMAKTKALLAAEQEILMEANLFQDANDIVLLKDSVGEKKNAMKRAEKLHSNTEDALSDTQAKKEKEKSVPSGSIINKEKEIKEIENKDSFKKDVSPSSTKPDAKKQGVKEKAPEGQEKVAALGEGWIEDDPLEIKRKTIDHETEKEDVQREEVQKEEEPSWWGKMISFFKNLF